MGKKKHDDGLTKTERKALKAREAEVMAELQQRATRAPDVSGLKRKALKALIEDKTNSKPLRKAAKNELARRAASERQPETSAPRSKGEPEAPEVAPPTKAERDARSPKRKTEDAADRVIAQPGTDGAKVAAKTAKAAASEASDDESDADIKARVKAKRDARKALEATRADIDLDDHKAVKRFNAALDDLGGGTHLVSNRDRAEAAHDAEREQPKRKPVNPGAKGSARKTDALPDESEVEYQHRKAAEKREAEQPAQVAEEVVTEDGREFAVGSTADEPERIAKPSEAERTDFEVNGNGQYKIKRPSDGKMVGYTRVTTYIDAIDDKTRLVAWKLRVLLEGVALADEPDESGRVPEPVVAEVRDLMHRRDVKIAKARKADRKGKLAVGELAKLIDDAKREFRKASEALADRLLDLGGVHEAAEKGTNLHELFEVYDRQGIDAVGDMLTDGRITPADLADVEAYARAIEAAGLRMIPECIERVVVNDELKVAGRMDRAALVRFPGTGRAVRAVADIKTGSIEWSVGKIAQQLAMYASAEGYDLDTHERTDLKLSRTKGVLIHVPQGTGTAFVHIVDLVAGREGNRIAGEVRAFRNAGKKAIDTKVNLAAPSPSSE